MSWPYFSATSGWSALNWTTSWSVWIVRTGMVELDALTPGPKFGFARYVLRSRLKPKPSTDVHGAVPVGPAASRAAVSLSLRQLLNALRASWSGRSQSSNVAPRAVILAIAAFISAARLAPTAMPGPELDPPVCRTGRPSLNGAVVRGSMRGSYELNPYPTFARSPPSWKSWKRSCEL